MNFVADENVEVEIIERLRSLGHDVWSVAELMPAVPDDRVLQLAREKQAVLLTADKDFGELVFRRGLVTSGVVFFRLAGLSNVLKANIVAAAVSEHLDEVVGAFTLVLPGMVRIRKNGAGDADETSDDGG